VGSAREKVLTEAALREGHYAAKQIFCRDRVIAWSHARRFEVGLRLARRFAGRRMLDYGCGDGTFIALLAGDTGRSSSLVGAELDDFQVNDCRARLGHLPRVAFESIARLDDEIHAGAYDLVVCMEVLEHVVSVDVVIDRLCRLLADDGVLLVSVPVEVGVPLLLKQAARRIAGWRGIGDYPGTSPYTLREYVASVFAGAAPHITRPVYNANGAMPFHDHKGFNWRALRAALERRVTIDAVVASPLPWLGPHLATQVWFVARRKSV
jgi:SAM-dependent methyltransferase